MKLLSLRLENIRSYVNETIGFADGVNLFQGDIGAGKSSILLGVEFALFGSTGGGSYDRLMRSGEKSASVTLDFIVGDNRYRAYRELKKGKHRIEPKDCWLEGARGREPLSWAVMRSRISELIGMKESGTRRVDLFHYTIYTPQESMKSILSSSAQERMEVIRRIFQLEEYKNAVNNIEIIRGRLREQGKLYEGRTQELDGLQEQKLKLEERVKEMEDEHEELEKQFKVMAEELGDLNEELVELREQKDEVQSLRKEKMELEGRQAQLEREVKKLDAELMEISSAEKRTSELEGKVAQKKDIKEEIDRIEVDFEKSRDLNTKKGILETELKNNKEKQEEKQAEQAIGIEASKEVDKLEKKLKELPGKEKNLEEIQTRLNELKVELKGLRNQGSVLKEELKDIDGLKAGKKCPKCQQPLSKGHIATIREDISDALGKIEREMKAFNDEDDELQKAMKAQKEKITSLKKLERTCKDLRYKVEAGEKARKVLKELEGAAEAINKELGKLKKELAGLKVERTRYSELKKRMASINEMEIKMERLKERARRRDELESSRKKALEDIQKAKDEKVELVIRMGELEQTFDVEHFDYTQKREKELRTTHGEIKGNINRNERAMKQTEEDLNGIKMRIIKGEEFRNKLERIKAMENWLHTKLKTAIQVIEEHRLLNINEDFRQMYTSWFQELLGGSEMETDIDTDFTPLVTQQGYDMPVDTLSGGERTSIALAYRLALNTMVKRSLGMESNLLILDEPTEGFSKDQLFRLKDVLDRAEAEQVIIVSHEAELSNLADSIYQVEKQGNHSRVIG